MIHILAGDYEKLKKGDWVTIRNYTYGYGLYNWCKFMDKYLGKTIQIKNVEKRGIFTFEDDEFNEAHCYTWDWRNLEPLNNNKTINNNLSNYILNS